MVTRPAPVKVEIPEHLRQCAEQEGTDPGAFRTRGDLLGGYGDERALRIETQNCHRETIRLVDVQNKAAEETRK